MTAVLIPSLRLSPVGTEKQARKNLHALIRRAGLDRKVAIQIPKRRYSSKHDNRYHFVVRCKARSVHVCIAGCALKVLTGDILYAPRVVVDGNTWWWKYAAEILRDHFVAASSL